MKNLLKKFRENKKGFTLAELLVVVAIISILVAVSIPVFTSQLKKATRATNLANARAAKAAAVAEYLTGNETNEKYYNYNIASGTVADANNKQGMDVSDSKYEINLNVDDSSTDTAYSSEKFNKFSVSIVPGNNTAATVTVYGNKQND